jgi:hypothetical protein
MKLRFGNFTLGFCELVWFWQPKPLNPKLLSITKTLSFFGRWGQVFCDVVFWVFYLRVCDDDDDVWFWQPRH